jgi:hypothetical protein
VICAAILHRKNPERGFAPFQLPAHIGYRAPRVRLAQRKRNLLVPREAMDWHIRSLSP